MPRPKPLLSTSEISDSGCEKGIRFERLSGENLSYVPVPYNPTVCGLPVQFLLPYLALQFRDPLACRQQLPTSPPGLPTHSAQTHACFRGLPPRRRANPASPNSTYRSFHTYNRLRRTPNSCATAITLSPASTRCTARPTSTPSNAQLASVRLVTYVLLLKNCHHFLCLSFGVHSTRLSPHFAALNRTNQTA